MPSPDAIKQEMWNEIRQLVLGDGPLPDEIDKKIGEMLEDEDPDDYTAQREGLFAEMVAIRCAQIIQRSPGPFQGAPLHMVLGGLAGEVMEREAAEMQEKLKAFQLFLTASEGIANLPMTTDEDEGDDD